MGSSLDWSRYAYTMDEVRYRAVMEAFVRMHDAGLIYRGNRIVNWDPKLQTTVSDDEIEYVERKDPFYYFQYGPFVIATVRPETKFGDKYVVMHPEDARYKEYAHGQKIDLEWINGPITATVIKDASIDMEKGSGVMTITPSHSAVDFEIAERHGLDVERVIDDRGILLPIAGEFAGQHIKKARLAIVEKLRSKGLVVKIDENYLHSVATNSRGGGLIEPQIKKQWFVAVNKEFERDGARTTLKEIMRKAVEGGKIKITPDQFERVYYHWIDNLRDWNISRQIWFGHRIPAWFKGEEVKVGLISPGEGWEQDPDVLDTWFSSGLWTFSTLGWPEQTADLKTFHPTSVLETGYDILFFWVARMILMSGFLLNDVPFKNVYLHGLVRDEKGRKMSKSLGNIIDPLVMVEKYGADALRLSLIMGAAPGNDIKLSEDRIRGYKNFANKLWNISRFVLESQDAAGTGGIAAEDQEVVDEARAIAAEATKHIESFRLDLAADALYQFIWHRFADQILEESKAFIKGGDKDRARSRAAALRKALETLLAALHPFMPFVTEEIWGSLPGSKGLLMVEPWPHK
jgi:valyl-tRNA synthetase